MNKSCQRILLGLLLVCGGVLLATPQDGKPSPPQPDSQNPVKKLARGVVEVIIGVGEIPIAIGEVEETDGPLQAVSYGSSKGICFFVLREVVGVVEIGTFFTPLPGTVEHGERSWGYGPLMEPEWVIE